MKTTINPFTGRIDMLGDNQDIIDDLAKKQDKEDTALTTTDKTIVGAINELVLQGKSFYLMSAYISFYNNSGFQALKVAEFTTSSKGVVTFDISSFGMPHLCPYYSEFVADFHLGSTLSKLRYTYMGEDTATFFITPETDFVLLKKSSTTAELWKLRSFSGEENSLIGIKLIDKNTQVRLITDPSAETNARFSTIADFNTYVANNNYSKIDTLPFATDTTVGGNDITVTKQANGKLLLDFNRANLTSSDGSVSIDTTGNAIDFKTASSGASSIPVETFPLQTSEGATSLAPGWYAILFNQLTPANFTKAQIFVQALHTSGTFQVAIYRQSDYGLVVQSSVGSFAVTAQGLLEVTFSNGVSLAKGMYFLVLFINHTTTRYLQSKRVVSNYGGSDSIQNILFGSTLTPPDNLESSITNQFPGNISSVDIPYVILF
ncbi:MAG: hypothetical protein LBM68_05480 [Bacteroidales bacterium]|jgi:hypothetical protein|nr:hypothetical protein [Bacteroidales bacterium]